MFFTVTAVENLLVLPQAAAAKIYPMDIIMDMANEVLDQDTGDMLEYW